eukprot:TRINITY_DN94018_c0_g1_i1.p1 TRINITY_DN94018_c0_g1~~TRINITY_DN94018_c0_g1_i1.p1  ORF type:complete len:403 (-),score=65.02 TRINITY_DN94018_c0_g1_i1:204-1349(-)
MSGTSDQEFQECSVYRFLGTLFPFKIPKYYFADICRKNTNYILITEKVLFGGSGEYLEGKAKKEFKPYEILPVAEKFMDFTLEPRMKYEMYYCIMRAQARLAAWDLLGRFDEVPHEFRGFAMHPPVLGTFEWPVKMKEKMRQMKSKSSEHMATIICDFLSPGQAGRCYSPESEDGAFVKELKTCISDAGAWADAIGIYPSMFPQMVAMQHQNLQSDNAYFWRNAHDEMDCGIIDWGGCAPAKLTAALLGSLTSAEGEVLHMHEEGFIRCFRDEFYKESGIWLDLNEMVRQWHLNYCMYMMSHAIQIEQEIFRLVPRSQWGSIQSLHDPKVIDQWNVRCYTLMIKISVQYLHRRWVASGRKRLHIYETFCEWRDYWVKKGMC